jgi:hypothetical protein
MAENKRLKDGSTAENAQLKGVSMAADKQASCEDYFSEDEEPPEKRLRFK